MNGLNKQQNNLQHHFAFNTIVHMQADLFFCYEASTSINRETPVDIVGLPYFIVLCHNNYSLFTFRSHNVYYDNSSLELASDVQ